MLAYTDSFRSCCSSIQFHHQRRGIHHTSSQDLSVQDSPVSAQSPGAQIESSSAREEHRKCFHQHCSTSQKPHHRKIHHCKYHICSLNIHWLTSKSCELMIFYLVLSLLDNWLSSSHSSNVLVQQRNWEPGVATSEQAVVETWSWLWGIKIKHFIL